jgi:PKD domain
VRLRNVLARRVAGGALLATAAAGFTLVGAPISAAVRPAATASRARTAAPAVRLRGVFAMNGRVTQAVNVRGEHRGMTVQRLWAFTAGCPGKPACSHVRLVRPRGSGETDILGLTEQASGTFVGRGTFTVALRCGRRIQTQGGTAPERIRVSPTRFQSVQQVAFVTAIRAAYYNPSRTNHTQCSGFIGHDGARYSGTLSSPLPSPPTAGFTQSPPAPPSGAVSFNDATTPGTGGAPEVQRSWNFGDPSSGSANTDIGASPTHTFSAPGTYTVTLSVTDANGLTSSHSSQVPAGPV